MDVRITPYSTSTYSTRVAPKKASTRVNSFYSRDRTQYDKLNCTSPTIQNKKLRSINNNSLLVISKKNSNKPQFSIKITSGIIQPAAVTDKKEVLLYQQIEKNKLFSNQSEQLNRFNYRV